VSIKNVHMRKYYFPDPNSDESTETTDETTEETSEGSDTDAEAIENIDETVEPEIQEDNLNGQSK
jgi:hypothetical protein